MFYTAENIPWNLSVSVIDATSGELVVDPKHFAHVLLEQVSQHSNTGRPRPDDDSIVIYVGGDFGDCGGDEAPFGVKSGGDMWLAQLPQWGAPARRQPSGRRGMQRDGAEARMERSHP